MNRGLIRWLAARQDSEGLTGVAFAAKLGVRQPLWWRARNRGEVRSTLLLHRAIATYPEHRDEIIAAALEREEVAVA